MVDIVMQHFSFLLQTHPSPNSQSLQPRDKMTNHVQLYVFGDQTFQLQPHLKHLLRGRSNPILADFLDKAYQAVRAELYRLPTTTREDLPRFSSLEDLVLWDQNGPRCVPLDMALTCLYQLGTFIDQTAPEDFNASTSRVLGLCTGALAAAAVSCSRSTSELVPLAVKAVIAAFHTGLVVADVTQRIGPSCEADQSWSMIVPGLHAAEGVEEFRRNSTLPLTSQPYVSAYAPNGITVSGTPSVLAQLRASEPFTGLRFKGIPIYGPYHAPHLYAPADIHSIINELPSDSMGVTAQLPSLGGSRDPSGDVTTFSARLEEAIEQILLHPIRWARILDELQASLQHSAPDSFRVVSIGSTADQLIYTALKQTPLRSLVPSTQTPSSTATLALSPPPSASSGRPKLAIIAMSGRYPNAQDNEAFWSLLHQGLDVHKPVPELHWSADTHVDPSGKRKNTSATPYGCWLDDPAAFDARFFNISPREAPQIDPAQRLALMTAYEAIEQAGLVPDATPSTRRDRVGVFYGVTSNDWMETNSAQNIDTYFIPGGNRAFIPGRINYYFKFSGPSYAVDTACSSSLAGIHLACNSLWRGDIDTAIAGGTNVLTNPDFTAGLDRGHFLSRTGNCKTFDDEADGYCRGEGVGTVIIKRLEDALAEKDPILGLILGAATNHSAESESITRPHSGAQRAIFNKILNQGAVDPYTVSYVEMHGTGTQAGDAGEMTSVLGAFAPPLDEGKAARGNDQPLYLGSAKANIGHGEAASGVTGLIKVLLMMQQDTIVPHCGIKTRVNRKFPMDLAQRNVNIAMVPTPWPRTATPRRAFVNNFSAAGGNSALLLEDAPAVSRPDGVDPRSLHLVAVSAKAGISLQGNLRALLAVLQKNPSLPLSQLSYTTTARRIHHAHRAMLVGASTADICTQIEAALRDNTGMTRAKTAAKVVFAFTGQGAQYPGMGRELWEHFGLFRKELGQLDRLSQSLGFPSVLPVILSQGEANIGAFAPTEVQLANVCLQIALSRLWASWGLMPTAVVGHSLGEYAALNVAGVLSDADTIYLVGKRAQLLESKCTRDTHAMLVVKASVAEIAQALPNASYEITCINSPVETVLGGSVEAVAALKEQLTATGLPSTTLKVPYAFHSSQVDPILPQFTRVAQAVTFASPRIPVIRPLDGQVNSDGPFSAEYLTAHAREPVNMLQALQTASQAGVLNDQSIVLEIGPHPAISGMVRAVLGSQMTTLASVQRARSIWQTLTNSLKTLYHAGADIRWAAYQQDFPVSHVVLPLPNYRWDLKPYWLQYVNDWSLRKGDPPLIVNGGPRLESTTIHRVLHETGGDAQKTKLVVEADIAREDLSPLVQGHEVDGIPLCTPSVYADMALSLGRYLLARYRPTQDKNLVDVAEMTISKALILRPGGAPQPLQAHLEVDWATQSAALKFMSFDTKGKLEEHSRCILRFTDPHQQQALLQASLPTIRAKMQRLRDGIAAETTARFNRPMVYRMIRPLARFHADYRAIDEVVLDSQTLEASSQLSFGSVKRGGDFHTHPAIIDALTQSCGFTMNCNDATDLDTEVFMNHGWGSFQIFEELSFEKVYTTYTQMKEGDDKLWHGDVVVMDGEKVVAWFGQIAIQGVPRRVLKVILSLQSGSRSTGQQQQQSRASAPGPIAMPCVQQQKLPAAPRASKFTQALAVIADESGIAVTELTDSTVFADVGIDSLLGLTISARFKEELDLDLEFNAFFFEYPTVGDLKTFLGGGDGILTPSSSQTADESGTATPLSDLTSGATTPLSESLVLQKPKVDFSQALAIISEESGVDVAELTDDTNFADSGVDSLLSLVIVSRFRDELQLDIQHESLFLECPTVADLRMLLVGTSEQPDPMPTLLPTVDPAKQAAELALRKHAVDALVEKYTAGFSIPSPLATASTSTGTVVLVTGATGGLGGHLTHILAQIPDVQTVVCLNRANKADPLTRQQRAMREKGIRFPVDLLPKLQVYQTDTAAPNLGLTPAVYDQLASTVTHLIHNAWPMSAKRPLAGFESQFQVARNLVDFACAAVARRPASFRFNFQMISSIGVVGCYSTPTPSPTGQGATIHVPETDMEIASVLPNGYSEAKWGCERLLQQTLRAHPEHFRPMVVRLGQIAGASTSGYWNPMEHFGFLVKSSQTLGALPDVDGSVFWTPVNEIAAAAAELVLAPHDREVYPVYHIENPVGQSWKDMNRILASTLSIPEMIPFTEWVARVRAAPQRNNPAATLVDFLEQTYLRMSCGGLVLDTSRAMEHSEKLRGVGPVSEEVVRKYVHVWREIGFLN
ncbi:ketoacyl-synt-domain-containing protein [Aspergillus homomorphus CBS 101889]|uniref:Ketoacyl-synt-domain-containing protein n=1 Tax=Aspergillus homomorphus (strain CBS 101889) TaxID=1450537 RepID=A0A395IF40_ASPHC|nr:ketoacyl-synt-domain-containing protein [Aspergillus homomorphus CBS 101889]RAL16794.1 ketoacyl-synt-domain-containing protein [Aspergillus homomorphus CBS 101889]